MITNFIATGVTAKGLKSFMQLVSDIFRTEMAHERFHNKEMERGSKLKLKIKIKN